MGNNERIEIGDDVQISYVGHGYKTVGRILYEPCAPGDVWMIRRDDGVIVYVQSFEAITLHKKAGA